MHDWTLVNILFSWEGGGQCRIELRDSLSKTKFIDASGVSKLLIPRKEEWGPSVSINEIKGPSQEGEFFFLNIEMQSGDIIELEARKILSDEFRENGDAGKRDY